MVRNPMGNRVKTEEYANFRLVQNFAGEFESVMNFVVLKYL